MYFCSLISVAFFLHPDVEVRCHVRNAQKNAQPRVGSAPSYQSLPMWDQQQENEPHQQPFCMEPTYQQVRWGREAVAARSRLRRRRVAGQHAKLRATSRTSFLAVIWPPPWLPSSPSPPAPIENAFVDASLLVRDPACCNATPSGVSGSLCPFLNDVGEVFFI